MKGFILLIMLVFLQVVTLLGLATLSILEMTLKACYVSRLQAQRMHTAKAILRHAEQAVPGCQIPVIAPNHLAKKSLLWWRQHACAGHLGKMQYYYLVESLGIDSCAMIKYKQNHRADYYRLTVFPVEIHIDSTPLLLQSVVVKAAVVFNICHSKLHVVTLGRQMWRAI